MNPFKGVIESKVTIEGEMKEIDDIMRYFLQNAAIEQTEYEKIMEEEEFIQKSKLFYNFLSKSERKGYSVLLDALQKFKRGSNCYKRYGKSFIIEFFIYFFPFNNNFLFANIFDYLKSSVISQYKLRITTKFRNIYKNN